MSATTRFKFIRRQQGVFLACLLPVCAGALSAATNACYTTARALQEALDDNTPRSGDFRLEGTVITPTADIDTFLFTDGTGFLRMTDGCFWPRRPFVAGDRVRLGGRIVRQDPAPYNYPKAFTIEILGHGPAPEPVDISAEDLYAGTCLNRIVRIRGTILDAQPDDINPRYVFLVVDAGDGLVYVPCLDPKFKDTYESLVGSRVELTGAVQRQLPDDTGRMIPLVVIMLTDTLRVLAPAVQEPHTIDTANDRYKAIAPILAGQPPLIRLRGTVLAAGQGHTILLRNQDGSVSTVSPISTAHPPPGTVIEAIGTAETDFYHLNLSRARWRKVSDVAQPPEPAERIDPGQIMSDTDGRLLAKSSYHGHTVRITGTVLSMPSLGNGRLMLDCRGMSVPVEVSTTPEVLDDLAVGCRLDVSGVCMLEIDNWRPQLPFPRIRGFVIIPRTPADIRILSHPPWWTVRKLLFVVAGLVLVIAGLVLRNLLARRLANIKLGERTRLAVELHDTIAQNLT
ncbi:MAG: hypothetical protein IKC14_02860, partial [Kiritimatiellae bacterium]|nr:hypothetical protein [Kiritimatiellia bacterium]